jgi:lipopolysaccharide export system permease protein
MKIIDRYILREHIGPFTLGLVVLTFILIMNRVFELVDLIVGKGLDVITVLEIFALSLPFILALTIPMSVLVAVLMAFGRFSQDTEVIAFKASGINFVRLLAPVIGAFVVVGLCMVWFNNHILPESNHQLKNLMIDVAQKKPALRIREGTFLQTTEGLKTRIQEIDQKTQEIFGITIYEITDRWFRTIVAQRGELQVSPEGDQLSIRLRHGEIHQLDTGDWWRYRKLAFESHTINVPVDVQLHRRERVHRGDREMSARMMLDRIEELRDELSQTASELQVLETQEMVSYGPPPTTNFITKEAEQRRRTIASKRNEIPRLLVEVHKKYSIPAACIAFVLIGAPLGAMSRRGGMGIGFGISLAFFVVYYLALVSGEELADRHILSPLWAMWSPNIILALGGAWLTNHVVHDVPLLSFRLRRRAPGRISALR